MPKYTTEKVCGHYLYFTSFCTIEAMHVHAGDEQLSEAKSAKFFVRADGSSVMKRRGDLTKVQQTGIQAYIKKHYLRMYTLWATASENGFYIGK